MRYCARLTLGVAAIIASSLASAAEHGRLPATGGAMTIDGAAGGGIVPMAEMVGLSTDPGWDYVIGSAALSVDDFSLHTLGVAASFDDRFEISLVEQRLGIDFDLPGALPQHIRQTVIGAKAKLLGDLIYGSLPQLSLGLQYRHVQDFDLAQSLGARSDDGIDATLSASRLFLDGPGHRNWLFNIGARASRANATGLLGFGGDDSNRYQLLAEASTAVFFNPQWALGAEYRQLPSNLLDVKESDWRDLFIGWFPNRHWSLLLAYTDLGTLANRPQQDGLFLSITGNP